MKVNLEVCNRLADENGNAGGVLFRLVQWWKCSKVRHGSYRWVAFTREEWAEQVGLSADKYRRAYDRLRALDLIVVETHRRKDGLVVPFIRPSEKTIEALSKPASGVGNPAHPGTGKSARPGTGKSARPTKNPKKNPKGKSSPSGEDKAPLPPKPKNSQEDLFPKFPPYPPKPPVPQPTPTPTPTPTEKDGLIPAGKETLAHLQALLAKQIDPTAITGPKAMEMRWVKLCAKAGFSVKVTGFTQAELGMAKHFLSAMGKDAAPVLHSALENWGAFAVYAEKAAGIKKAPETPSVAFLTKHAAIARDHWLSIQKPAKEAAGGSGGGVKLKAAPLPAAPAPIKKPIKPEELPMTPEEFDAAWNYWFGKKA